MKKLVSMLLVLTACTSLAGCGSVNVNVQKDTVNHEGENEADEEAEEIIEELSEEVEVLEATEENLEVATEEETDEAVTGEDTVADEEINVPEIGIKTYFGSDVDENKLVSANYRHEVPFLFDDSAEKYSELNEAINDLAKRMQDNNIEAIEYLNETRDAILESRQDEENDEDAEIYRYSLEDNTEVDVMRADESLVSFKITNQGYSAGAHGYTTIEGVNIDSKTGELLSIDDVVTDRKAFFDLAKEEMLSLYYDVADQFFNIDTVFDEYVNNEDANIVFYLTGDSIGIVCNEYEIGPYSAGHQEVTIKFDDEPELFKDTYTKENIVNE